MRATRLARLAVATLAAGAFAAVALGQNADKNSAGPTRNDYRIRVVEPAEGATITGSSVHVVVNTEIPGEVDTRRDVNSMPRPWVDVFLDDSLKGTMKEAENVLDIESVSPGTHKLVLLAKNRANEVIDRKELQVTMIASAAAPAPAAVPARPAPPPSTSSSDSSLAGPPARESVPPAPPSSSMSTRPSAPPPPAPPAESARARTIPATASDDPALILAGAALLAGGLMLRRFA